MFFAIIEFYVVNIFLDALLLAAWTYHQNIFGVDNKDYKNAIRVLYDSFVK